MTGPDVESTLVADVSTMPLRLRTYWTRGEGAGKIRWGQPKDFDRCVRELTKVGVPLHAVKGTCANLHKEALGVWPGQEDGGRRASIVADYTSQDFADTVMQTYDAQQHGMPGVDTENIDSDLDLEGLDSDISHAGILMAAEDTGRWLMLQRALEDGDDNGGLWEFPGGGREDDESPLDAACREFAEECGVGIPDGCEVRGAVIAPSGNYVLYIVSIPHEGDYPIDDREVQNPDDPDGDMTEALAWWDPDHVTPGGYHIRPEVQKTNWDNVQGMLQTSSPYGDENGTAGGDTMNREHIIAAPFDEMTAPDSAPPVDAPSGSTSNDAAGLLADAIPLLDDTDASTVQAVLDGLAANQTIDTADVPAPDAVVAADAPAASEPPPPAADATTTAAAVKMLDDLVATLDPNTEQDLIDAITKIEDTLDPNDPDDQTNPDSGMTAAAPDPTAVPTDVTAPAPADTATPDAGPVDPASPEGKILKSLSNHHEQMIIEISDFLDANPDSTLVDELKQDSDDAQAFVDDVTAQLSAPAADAGPTVDLTPTPADALVASVASQSLLAPPDEWFEPFDMGGPTPITITADGRVYGHLADWKSCHRNPALLAAGQCVRPPSDPNPAFFYSGGQVLTASGALIDVGRLTVGGGHADTRKGIVAALEHYDDASSVGAVVRVHEDEYGIGLYGSIVADASPEQVAAMRRSPFSGDWRKERGRYRLIAAHAVNTGGYPIPREHGLVASVTDTAFITTGRVNCKSCGEEAHSLPDSVVASVVGILAEEMTAAMEEEKQALVAGMVDDFEELKNQLIDDFGEIEDFLDTAVGDENGQYSDGAPADAGVTDAAMQMEGA